MSRKDFMTIQGGKTSMTKEAAKNHLIDIMEAVEDAGRSCDSCPFYELVENIMEACPFQACPEIWDL